MKNNYLSSLLILFIFSTGLAQNNEIETLQKKVSSIEQTLSQVESKLDKQLSHIQKQDKKIESYERALRMLESVHEGNYKGLEFHVNKVIGSKSNNNIIVQGIAVNTSQEEIKLSAAKYPEFFDNEGNHKKGRFQFTENSTIALPPNISIKFSAKFNNLESLDVAKITALRLYLNDLTQGPLKATPFELLFNNIEIDWRE